MASILDWTGVPARRRYPRIGLYESPSDRPNESRPRPILREHTFQNITSWQRWDLMNYARVIRAGIPNIDTALQMKANFAFGNACQVKYHGFYKPWGRRIEGHINGEFYSDCNCLGPEHDFLSTMSELSAALDCDGGYAVVFDGEDAEGSESTGRFTVIPATRIGNGWGVNASGGVAPLGQGSNDLQVWGLAAGGWGVYAGVTYGYMLISDPASPFYGQRIIDGFIVDRHMRRLGVRLLGFNADGTRAYQDIPANKIHVNFRSKWTDQIGFIPELATSVMAITNVQDFDYYIKQAMILSAAMGVTRKSKTGIVNTNGVQETVVQDPQYNADGTPALDGDGNQKTVSRTIRIEDRGAGIVELSTDNDEEIGSVSFERPSMNEEAFIERVERGYLAKHWPYDLIYGKELGRAFTRAVGQQVKMIIWDTQRTVGRTMKWIVDRRIEWSMRKGRIPVNNAAYDPYDYHFVWPAEFTTDEGNDRQADRDDLKMSLTTRTWIAGKNGESREMIDAIRMEEEIALAENAKALAQKYPFLNEQQWLERLDQRSPNPSAIQNNPEPDGDEPKPTKPGAKE